MEKYCDLHTHSTYSDGTYTPAEIIDTALDIGLSAVALCDHNTVDGLYELEKHAEGKNIEAVSGIEFSVEYDGFEIHILGLWIKREHYGEIKALLNGVINAKEESNRCLVDSLNAAGYNIDYSEVKSRFEGAVINRSHIAVLLTEKGYTKSISDAMEGILSVKAGFYKPPRRLSAFDCLDFISKIGAVSVLAHPFLNLSKKKIRKFLPEAKLHGLVGIECEYSAYDDETTQMSLALAEEFGLLVSGGSDFHGTRKPDTALGVGKGNLKISMERAIALKNKASN